MQIDTPERLLSALIILDDNLPNFKLDVNATADEIAAVSEYRANLTTAINNSQLVEQDRKNVTRVKNDVYNGNPKEGVSKYATFSIEPLPFPDLKGDAKGFYSNLKARYKTAAGYTKAIGFSLGFENEPTEKPPIDTMVGTAELKTLNGYRYQADFIKRGMTGMLFQHRLKGTEKWFDVKFAINSPVIIHVDAPSIEGAAVQIEVRCCYLLGNDPVGQWSPAYSLTVNP